MDNVLKKVDWTYKHKDGYLFENELSTFFNTLLEENTNFQLTFTKNRNDGGIDGLIEYDKDFEWMGYNFKYDPLKNKDKKCYILIEIKHRTSKLTATDIKKYTSQKNDNYNKKSYQIVVTDNYTTANVHADAYSDSRRCDFEFILIDKNILLKILQKYSSFHDIDIPKNIKFDSFNYYTNIDKLKDKVDSTVYDDNLTSSQQLNIQLYNFTDKDLLIDIVLFNDLYIKYHDTFTKSKNTLILIPANQVIIKSYTLSSYKNDIAKLSISYENATLIIKGNVKELQFEPNLYGNQHLNLLEELKDIKKNKDNSIVYLHGASGVGKSRVINDLNIQKKFKFSKESNFKTFLKENNITDINQLHSKNSIEYIVFDDIHLADKNFFDDINSFSSYTKKRKNHTKLLLIGRDDFTYNINIEYEKFKHQSKKYKDLYELTLKEWNEEECRAFLQKVIPDIPIGLENRIVKLSNNNPLWVTHSIRYLIDMTLLEVYNSSLLGIVNLELIGSKDYIPKEVESLLDLRFNFIADNYKEINLLSILISLSYIDSKITIDKFNKIYNISLNKKKNIYNQYDLFKDLENKAFIKNTRYNNEYEFNHENIYLYLIKKIEEIEFKKDIGNILISYYENEDIENYEKGFFYFLIGSFNEASKLFEEIIDEINEKSNNISSINIDSKYLKYFRPIYLSLFETGKNNLVLNVIKAETHLSTHLRHLKKSIEVSNSSLEFINKNNKKLGNKTDLEILRYGIRQQISHSKLNLGHVLYARSEIEDVLADIEIFKRNTKLEEYQKDDIKKIVFDARDRLQNIYHQLNNHRQFIYNSILSEEIAGKDEKLLSLVKSSRVKEFYYTNPSEHLKLTKEATNNALENASSRHQAHARLNLCIAKLLVTQQKQDIEEIQKELKELLDDARENEYTFSISRATLAIATTYALLGLNNKLNLKNCNTYCDLCIESIIEYGNGYFHWQVYNLKAILTIAKSKNNKKEANGYFLTAIESLKKYGILNLTNFDLLNTNLSVITNYFLFIKEFYNKESLMFWFFKKLEYTGKCYDDEEIEFKNKILDSLDKYRFIGIDSKRNKLTDIFIEPYTKYYLSLR